MDNHAVHVVTRLKYERLRRRLSQERLAHFASLAPSDLSKIERGILQPYPRQAARLAAVLGIGVEDLLVEVGNYVAEAPVGARP